MSSCTPPYAEAMAKATALDNDDNDIFTAVRRRLCCCFLGGGHGVCIFHHASCLVYITVTTPVFMVTMK